MNIKRITLSVLAAISAIGFSAVSSTSQASSETLRDYSFIRYSEAMRRLKIKEVRKGFDLGVCVGQTLATTQPAILLPAPGTAQISQKMDQNTITALLAAVKTCRMEMVSGSVPSQSVPNVNPSTPPAGSSTNTGGTGSASTTLGSAAPVSPPANPAPIAPVSSGTPLIN